MATEFANTEVDQDGQGQDPLGLEARMKKHKTGPAPINGKDPLGLEARLKKKEGSVGGQVSPSGSTDTKIKTATLTSPSESTLPNLHESIFGGTYTPVTGKPLAGHGQQQQEIKSAPVGPSEDEKFAKDLTAFEQHPDVQEIADEKGTILSRAEKRRTTGLNKEDKEKVHNQIQTFKNNFFNAGVTAEDVQAIHGPGLDLVTAGQVAQAINNKTVNLKKWADASVAKGAQGYLDEMGKIDKKISELYGDKGDTGHIIASLANQKQFLKKSYSAIYDNKATKASSDILADMQGSQFTGGSWEDIFENPDKHVNKGTLKLAGVETKSPIQYRPDTKTLTTASEKFVRNYVDKYMNSHPDDIINAQTVGTTDKPLAPEQPTEPGIGASLVGGGAAQTPARRQRNYPDIANRVIDYLNTTVPVKAGQAKYSNDFADKHPEAKSVIQHQQSIQNYFTKSNIDAADAYAKSYQDKQFVNLKEKYWGNTGLLTTNPTYVQIQHEYARRVANKEMSDEVAKNNMMQEIQNNPALKRIYDNQQKEVNQVMDKTKAMFGEFIQKGLTQIDPQTIYYPDGTVGIKGKTKDESKKIMDEYDKGLARTTAETMQGQSKALMSDAQRRLKSTNAFFSSFGESLNDMQASFSKYWFYKTGYGGDDVRMFQAEQHANIPISQTEEAKKWNWSGLESLKNPNFYFSQIGKQLPIFAGVAAVSAATEGAGAPAALDWLASAGLFDAQMAMSTFNELSTNGVDKYGNKLTEMDAATAAADRFKETILPDMLFMAANSGILSRAKIAKPTFISEVGGTLKGAVVGAIPMTWQNYLGYANNMRAEGKTPDMWDYAQDPSFASGLIEGMIGGGIIGLSHIPSRISKSTENWKRLIYQAQGEMQNYALFHVGMQHEMNGYGDHWRDQLKIKLATENLSDEERENVKQALQYSTAVERNVKNAGIDMKDVSGAFQAHSLALADLHDQWSEAAKDKSPNLSAIYAEQAKDFRKQAKEVMEGKGKYKFLSDKNGDPIFLSDNAFKVLDGEGKIADWMENGLIESVHASDDPNFSREYMEKIAAMKAPEVVAEKPIDPEVENEDQKTIITALQDHAGDLKGAFKMLVDPHIGDPKHHEEIVKEIISQAVDHPEMAQENLGNEAWEKIKPFVEKASKEKIRQQKEQAEALKYEFRKPEEAEGILNKDIGKLGREIVTLDGKELRADIAVKNLKAEHDKLSDLLKDCL